LARSGESGQEEKAMQDDSTGNGAAHASVRERLHEELREYAIVFVYLYICLGILLLYKSVILNNAGIAFVPAGIAALKALILGKFLLIGKAVGVGDGGPVKTLLHRIVRKSVLLLVLLVVLSAVEELVTGWFHGHSFAQTLVEFGSRASEIAVSSLLMLMVLVPFVGVAELSRVLGPNVLMRALRGQPPKP
jgi:hypothetical protein